MAFTWVNTVTQYAPITAIIINEVRSNCDALNNTRSSYCVTHYNGYDNAVYHSNRSTHYPGDYPTYYSYNRTDHYTVYETSKYTYNYPTYLAVHDSLDCATENTINCGANKCSNLPKVGKY